MTILDIDKYYYFKLRNGNPYQIKVELFPINTAIMRNFVEMSTEQREFYLANPTATVMEVWQCELTPPYVPPVKPLEEIKAEAKSELDKYSRETLGKVVDTLAFCDAIAGTVYSGPRGIDSIYSDNEIFLTADEFLSKGKLLRDRLKIVNTNIDSAITEEDVNEIVVNTKEYFDFVIQPSDDLDKHKKDKIREIEAYDVSENVNGFFLNGTLLWLNKDTRTGLVNTLNSAVIVGREDINIWFSGMYITLHIDEARQMLATLEIYATDCYNVTAQHKMEVMSLVTIDEVDAYDVTVGYPQRPEFNINRNIN